MTTQLVRRDENSGTDFGGSLVESLLSPKVTALAPSLTDVVLGRLLSETILSQIPVFETAFKIYKGVTSIQNDLYLRKIAYFLCGCEKKDSEEKTKFEKELEMDSALRTKVGENLLLILERIDHFEKATILGKVFMGRLREDIDEDTFFKLATAINNASITDLRTLDLSYDKIATYNMKAGKPFSDTLDHATSQALFNVGFVRADGYTEITYLRNELGSCLLNLLKHE